MINKMLLEYRDLTREEKRKIIGLYLDNYYVTKYYLIKRGVKYCKGLLYTRDYTIRVYSLPNGGVPLQLNYST